MNVIAQLVFWSKNSREHAEHTPQFSFHTYSPVSTHTPFFRSSLRDNRHQAEYQPVANTHQHNTYTTSKNHNVLFKSSISIKFFCSKITTEYHFFFQVSVPQSNTHTSTRTECSFSFCQCNKFIFRVSIQNRVPLS